ncbi:hypothetical protein IGI37_000783 [Enterococcus sp. AZ194]|uniref:hypothetical protein n=1 Tax=Enterococcus sp. AZ194 TaxID=2774629 RepID=UPI003F27E6D8
MNIQLKKVIKFNFSIQFFLHIFLFYIKYSKINDQVSFMKFYNIILVVYFLSALAVVLTSRFYIDEILILLIVLLFLVVQFVHLKNETWIITFLSLLALKEFNLKKIIQSMFFATFSAFLLVVILNYFGTISEFILVRDGTIRHSFGFSHPNFFGAIIFVLFFEYIYIYGDKSKKLNVVLFLLALYSTNQFSGSRNAVISLIVGFCIILISKIITSNRILTFSCYLLLPFSFFISTWAAKSYSNIDAFWISIDKILSGRVRFANMFYQESPPSLLGNKIEMLTTEKAQDIIGATTKILDNAYMSILLKFGIIFTVILCTYFMIGLYQTWKYDQKKRIVYALIFIIFGFSESYFTFFEFNFSYIIIMNYIYYSKRRGEL